MIITYVPKGSPDEDDYLKKYDEKDDSRVGSFVIKLNNPNQNGGAKICMDYDTRLAPSQSYNAILKKLYNNAGKPDQKPQKKLEDFVNKEKENRFLIYVQEVEEQDLLHYELLLERIHKMKYL